MVTHTRLQYYNYNCGTVCLTGLFGCRWHRYKQSHDSTAKRDWLCFLLLLAVLLFTVFLFYYWLVMFNYEDWFNTFLYENLETWFNFYLTLFVLTAVTLGYLGLLLFLALCHLTCGYEIYLHWLHKGFLILIASGCIATTIILNFLWPAGWNLQALSLQITAPFLHITVVGIVTLLSWVISGQWAAISNKCGQVVLLLIFFVLLFLLYTVPLFINSPCICEKQDLPERPHLFAHMGASAMAPENTLISFQLALNNSAFGIETDVAVSQDGEPFLLHDPTLHRTTNVKQTFPEHADYIASYFNLSNLQSLDAGSWYLKSYQRSCIGSVSSSLKAQYKQQRIPSLSELLDLVSNTGVNIMFDRRRPPKNHPNREDYSQRIIDVILQSSIPEKQIYWLGDLPGNASERPGFTRVEYGGDDLNVSQLEEEGYTQLNAQTDEISLEDINYFQAKNISVHIYLVNTAWLLSLYWCVGTFAVTTDYIHTLRHLSAPVWHLTPKQYQIIWVCVDTTSLVIILIIFIIQKYRHRHKEPSSETLSIQPSRIHMNHMRRTRTIKQKLLHTMEGMEEIERENGGIVGVPETPPVDSNGVASTDPHGFPASMDFQRFSTSSSEHSAAAEAAHHSTVKADSPQMNNAGVSLDTGALTENRFSGVSGLSAISGLAAATGSTHENWE